MKTFNFLLILPLLLLGLAVSCKKKDVQPVEQLPAATQEGKNTFGCLINGKAFTPGGSMFAGPLIQCYYQPINGEYYFHVSAVDKRNVDRFFDVNINTNGLTIEEGTVIPLVTGNRGEATAAYGVYDNYGPGTEYRTNSATTGELIITHFNIEKQIVSGTFWFNAVNDKGEKVEIREGRFDMQVVM